MAESIIMAELLKLSTNITQQNNLINFNKLPKLC